MTDTYTTADGRSIRLINDDILLRVDPIPDKVGSIILPQGAVEHVYNTGTVLAVGYQWIDGETEDAEPRRVALHDIAVGEKWAFVRFLAEQHTNKWIQEHIETGVIRVKASDLLFCFDEEDRGKLFR